MISFENKKLAIEGQEPVRKKPWAANLTLGREEIEKAVETLEEGLLSLFEGSYRPDPPFSFWGGPRVQRLEEGWAKLYGVPYAVSMNSATSCLIAAIGALGIGYGDEVIVSPYTMTASAACPLFYGAIPIFADVKLETGSLDPDSIEKKVTPRTRAIVVVHQFGIPAQMERILEVARRHDLFVIEDCAQAHGALYQGKPVGTFGQIGIFSLNVNKAIQVGEGGVCVTGDPDLRMRLALIRNHGEAVVEAAGYEKITNIVGFNFRLTEIAAAMAIEQLKKLELLNERRLELVEYVSRSVARHRFLVPPPLCPHAAFGDSGAQDGCRSVYYLYPLRFLKSDTQWMRGEFVKALCAEGVPFSEGYTPPLYLQPLYQKKQAFKGGYPFTAPPNREIQTNYEAGSCPVAQHLYFEEMIVNEFVRPPHTLEDMKDIARAVDKVAAARLNVGVRS